MRSDLVRRNRLLLVAPAGWFVWAACFAVLYLVQGLGCHSSMQIPNVLGFNGLNVVLAALWIGHMALIAGLEVLAVRGSTQVAAAHEPHDFLRRLTRINNLTSFTATLWIGFPVVLLSPCT